MKLIDVKFHYGSNILMIDSVKKQKKKNIIIVIIRVIVTWNLNLGNFMTLPRPKLETQGIAGKSAMGFLVMLVLLSWGVGRGISG